MRRIVSVSNVGRSPQFLDADSSGHRRSDAPSGLTIDDLWATSEHPGVSVDGADAGRDMPLLPRPGGTCFRFVTIDPGQGMPLHTTNTVDYLVIVSGRIVRRLDGGAEIDLVPGDAVVQLGALHAWKNRGKEVCVMAAVVISAEVPPTEYPPGGP